MLFFSSRVLRFVQISPVIAILAVMAADSRLSFLMRAEAQPVPSACVFPTVAAATPEQTAWQLFVAAHCPVAGTKVVWENWIEQSQLYSSGQGAVAMAARPAPRRLHASLLAQLRNPGARPAAQLLFAPDAQCGNMNAPPNNVTKTTICEEARLNSEAARFVTSNGYQSHLVQGKAAQKGTDIQFPGPAIEVKVDWIPASDFNPVFTCSKPPPGIHVELVDGVCYAMAGIHISSKLVNNWVWATFEPQSMLTNPLRCITFGPCNDPWGSVPARSSGGAAGFTQQSPGLKGLMQQAHLASEFANYRLDGVQVDFVNKDGSPSFLGNSIIEGENVGMKKDTVSCITCHSVSSVKTDGTDGQARLGNTPLVGKQTPPPPGWIARDFVWSMSLAGK